MMKYRNNFERNYFSFSRELVKDTINKCAVYLKYLRYKTCVSKKKYPVSILQNNSSEL